MIITIFEGIKIVCHMSTNSKFNIKILLVWLGFCLITIALALFIANAIDFHPCWWKATIGILAFVVLIYGTARFGAYVNQIRYILLAEEKKKEKAAKK